MARKNTYASVMDSMSKKLATYQDRLSQAEKQGDHVGIQDYTRRIQKVNQGIETLFNTQEQSKASQQMKYGGNTKYAEGGLTQNLYAEYKFINSLLPQERTPEQNARFAELQTMVDDAGSMYGWNPDMGFNPDGSLGNITPEANITGTQMSYAPGEEQYAGMSQQEIEQQMRADATGLEVGRPEQFYNPYNQRMYDVTDQMYSDMQTGSFGQNMELGNYEPPPPVNPPAPPAPSIPTPESMGLGMPAITGAAPLPPDVQTFTGPYDAVTTPTELVPGTKNIATDSVSGGSSGLEDINIGGAPEVRNAPASNNLTTTGGTSNTAVNTSTGTNTNTGNLKDFFSSIAGEPNKLAQYGQFIPDAFAAYQMSRTERPADMPSMTMARMNTDINVNPQIAQAQQKLAASEEAIDSMVNNPIVAAALKRSARNEAAQVEGNVRADELNTEMGLQNQYAQAIADTSNRNSMIDFQNEQRGIDFTNDKRAAAARMLQQTGTKLSQIYGENQNREADLKRLGLSTLMYDQGMQQRLMGNYQNLQDLIGGGRG